MSDDPQPGEIMRRLDEVSRQLADIGRRMDEREKQAAATYVRQDVYMANRQMDQAVTAVLQGDVRVVEEQVVPTEVGKRNGVLGSAVVQDRVTDLVDLDAVVRPVLAGAR